GYRPVNVDLVVHAEAPRLGAYKQAIRRAIAERLGLELEAVNVKAKTAEQLGAIGTGQAIACTAIVGLGRSQGQ
ncbi:MAG: 2-C-methyl-D-erythritol 2,4-cyclodiphosphate synthase, partial [Phycisphaerae bacterium]